MPPMSNQTRPPPPNPEQKGPPWSGVRWAGVAVYVLMTLGMLWFWQETDHFVAPRTIPYSEFKRRLAQGEVVECVVSTDAIQGKIEQRRTRDEQTKEARNEPSTTTKPEIPGPTKPKGA